MTTEQVIEDALVRTADAVAELEAKVKSLNAKPEGLSEDNAVKVWLDLREELRTTFLSADCPRAVLYELLTQRFIAAEKKRALKEFTDNGGKVVESNVPPRHTP